MRLLSLKETARSPVRVWSGAFLIYEVYSDRQMKTVTNMSCKKHIFVCVNDRGLEKDCCMNVKGYETFKALKEFVINNGLAGSVWVTKTGCLGFCNEVGCTIAVYPDKVWFLQTTDEDLSEVKEFIIK